MKKVLIILMLLFPGMMFSQIPSDKPPFWDDSDLSRRERIENLYIWKLTEYLDLTEEQSYKFFPRLKKFREEEDQKKKELRETYLRAMEILNSEEEIDKKEFQKVLNQVEKLERGIFDSRIEFIRKQEDILTPEQQLKVLIFNERFRQHLGRMIKKYKD